MIGVRSSRSKEKLPSKGIIFIGDFEDALDIHFLKHRHIVGIINAAVELPNKSDYYPAAYLKLDLYDLPYQDILGVLSYAYKFLEQNLQTGNVLVHCAMGISRSVALVIGYLLLKFPDLTYDYIYQYIKSHRSQINPNTGFKNQLLSLETN